MVSKDFFFVLKLPVSGVRISAVLGQLGPNCNGERNWIPLVLLLQSPEKYPFGFIFTTSSLLFFLNLWALHLGCGSIWFACPEHTSACLYWLIYFSDVPMFDHLVGESSEVSNGPLEILEINHQDSGIPGRTSKRWNFSRIDRIVDWFNYRGSTSSWYSSPLNIIKSLAIRWFIPVKSTDCDTQALPKKSYPRWIPSQDGFL